MNKTQTGGEGEADSGPQVSIEPDRKPSFANIPSAIRKVLAADPEARAAFERISSSHRREYFQWIISAKKPETLERRLQQFVRMLMSKQRATRRLR